MKDDLIKNRLEQHTNTELYQISNEINSPTVNNDGLVLQLIVGTGYEGIPVLSYPTIAYFLQAEFAKRLKLYSELSESSKKKDESKPHLINPKDCKALGDAILDYTVRDIRELQVYLEQTYTVHLVIQANELPRKYESGGYAAGS